MAYYRFILLHLLGFLIAAHGSDGASGEVEQTTKGKKDLLSAILPPDRVSTGGKASQTGNRTSETLDDLFSSLFDDSRENHSESTPNSSSNENSHFHLHQTGDFNAGSMSNESRAPVSVNSKVNEDRASGDHNGSHSIYARGKGNSSYGVLSESSVHFPDEGSSEIEAFEGTIGINENSDGSVVGRVGDKGGKYSKETKDNPPKIDVEPYFIIDAPIRESDDSHGCKEGQRWSFGHCRDILD